MLLTQCISVFDILQYAVKLRRFCYWVISSG